MRKLLVSIIYVLSFLLSGCVNYSLGPINISHNDGELPKIDMNTGVEQCKVKAKIRSDSEHNEIKFECKFRFR